MFFCIKQSEINDKIRKYYLYNNINRRILGMCRGLSMVWAYFTAINQQELFWEYIRKFLAWNIEENPDDQFFNSLITAIIECQDHGTTVELEKILSQVTYCCFKTYKSTWTYTWNYSEDELVEFFELLVKSLEQNRNYLDKKVILIQNNFHMCALSYKENDGFSFYDPNAFCIDTTKNIKALCNIIYKKLSNEEINFCPLSISIITIFESYQSNEELFYLNLKEFTTQLLVRKIEVLKKSANDPAVTMRFKIWLLFLIAIAEQPSIELIEQVFNEHGLKDYKNQHMKYLLKYKNIDANHICSMLAYNLAIPLIFDLHEYNTELELQIRSENAEILKKTIKRHINKINDISPYFQATALMQAAYFNKVDVAKILLDNGADVNVLNEKGATALKFAVLGNNYNMCLLLLRRGADPNLFKDSAPPLHVAHNLERFDLCKLLLKYKADPNNLYISNRSLLVYNAINVKNMDFCKLLLDYHINPNIKIDSQYVLLQYLIFHYTTWNSEQIEIFKLLLQHGADPNLTDHAGNTALHIAVSLKKQKPIKLLLEHNADLTVLNNKNQTPLHIAIKDHNNCSKTIANNLSAIEKNKDSGDDIVTILIDHHKFKPYDLDVGDSEGNTALHYAIEQENPSIFLMLLEQGADPNRKNSLGFSPFLTLVNAEQLDFIGNLLSINNKLNNLDLNETTFDGETALHIAVKKKNKFLCRMLLEAGIGINLRNSEGLAALHLAVKNNDCKMVALLLLYNADLCITDREYINPIEYAIKAGNNPICELLLKYHKGSKIKIKKNINWLREAVEQSNFNICKLLLESGIDPNTEDFWKKPPLLLAIKTNNIDIFKLLLESNADPNAKDGSEMPLLYVCLDQKKSDFYQELFRHGANPNIADKNKNTLLELAIKNNRFDICEILLANGADLALIAPDLIKYFNEAFLTNNLKIINLLCKHFKKYPILKNGELLINLVITKNDLKLLNYLIGYGLELNLGNSMHRTPLHTAIELKNLEVCELLLKNGADPNITLSDKENSILHFAIHKLELSIIKLLLRYGAKLPDSGDCHFWISKNPALCKILLKYNLIQNSLNIINQDPLFFYAIKHEDHEISEMILKDGYNINAKNKYGETALHSAIDYNRYLSCKFLLKHGININSKDADGMTALHRAVKHGSLKIINLLLKHHAKVNISSNKGITPLHLAVYYNHKDLVELLLQNNANINAKSNNKFTPIMLAYFYGNLEIFEYLCKQNAKLKDLLELNSIKHEFMADTYENVKIKAIFYRKINNLDITMLSDNYCKYFKHSPTQLVKFVTKNIILKQTQHELYKLLHLSIIFNRIDVCDFLLKNKLIDFHILKNNAAELLKISATKNRVDFIKLFIEHNLPDAEKIDQTFIYEAMLHRRIKIYDLYSENINVKHLYEAIDDNKEVVCELILNRQPDLQVVNDYDRTPLQEAISDANFTICKMLLETGADPNFFKNKYPPIYTAILRADDNIIKLLLKYGADLNCLYKEGSTILLDVTKRTNEIHRYRRVCFKLLFFGADPNKLDTDGCSSLINAINAKEYKLCKMLLEYGADPNLGYLADFPIYVAINAKLYSICELLIKHGAKLDSARPEAAQLITAMIQQGNIKFFKNLLSITSIESHIKQEAISYIIQAIEYKQAEIGKLLLLKFKIRPNLIVQNTPILHLALQNQPIVVWLLENGANVNILGERNRTALHLAAINGNVKLGKLLIKYNANINILDQNGFTPFGLAVLHGKVGFLKLLLDHHADPNLCGINTHSPYFIAELYNYNEIVNLLGNNEKFANTDLVSRDFPYQNDIIGEKDLAMQVLSLFHSFKQIKLVNHAKAAPIITQITKLLLAWEHKSEQNNINIDYGILHIAVNYGLLEVAQLLLELGYDVNARSKKIGTPVIVAIKQQHYKLLKLLLDHKADLTLCIENLNTPLHIAVDLQDFTAISMLLEYGADPNSINIFNITPTQLAKSLGFGL